MSWFLFNYRLSGAVVCYSDSMGGKKLYFFIQLYLYVIVLQTTSFCATNLAAHNPFFFRVSARNKIGYSQPSPTSDVMVTKDNNPSHRLSVDSDGKTSCFYKLICQFKNTSSIELWVILQHLCTKQNQLNLSFMTDSEIFFCQII